MSMRQARQSRPQLVCVLADNSGSMRGPKAEAATNGIREMLMQCQSRGPRGRGRSYFQFVLIKFGDKAEVVPHCNMTPVRHIDPESVSVVGDGRGTNLTAAVELVCDGLERYLHEVVRPHPERSKYPLPIVIVFSDGRNGYGRPEPSIEHLKSLRLDGESIPIAVAGVSVNATDKLDEGLLKSLASPDCYLPINKAGQLRRFISSVGSSAASSQSEVAHVVSDMRPIEMIPT